MPRVRVTRRALDSSVFGKVNFLSGVSVPRFVVACGAGTHHRTRGVMQRTCHARGWGGLDACVALGRDVN